MALIRVQVPGQPIRLIPEEKFDPTKMVIVGARGVRQATPGAAPEEPKPEPKTKVFGTPPSDSDNELTESERAELDAAGGDDGGLDLDGGKVV